LHVTLKFLGWVSQERAEELAGLVVRHAAACTAIDTSFAGVVAFSSPRRARIVAAALSDAEHCIARLFAALEGDLELLGIPREERVFRPHVTLARIKRPGDVREWLAAAELGADAVRFGELVLYRSRLGPHGSTYEPLARAALAASGAQNQA
jgi:2'-5' RNA ligase